MKTIEVIPFTGVGNLEFGFTVEEVEKILGKPDEIELLENEEEAEMPEITYSFYEDRLLTLFFEMNDEVGEVVLTCAEIESEDTLLFGKKVIGINEEALIEIMKENGYEKFETEVEEWGEKRISFDDVLMDFYLEEGLVSTLNWGALIIDEEE